MSAADFGETRKVIKGFVTSKEVSSLTSPLEVKPGCLGRVGGDVEIGWNISRAIVRPSNRLLIALRASSGWGDRRRLMFEDSRTPESTSEVSGRSQNFEFPLSGSKRSVFGDERGW